MKSTTNWTRATSVTVSIKKTMRAALLAILGMLIVAVSVPVASADTGDDLARGLGSNSKYYISDPVKSNQSFNAKNPNLEQKVREAVNRVSGKEDTRVAVITDQIIPGQFAASNERYADFLYSFLSNPKPDVLILVNAQSSKVVLRTSKLSSNERQALVDDTLSVFQRDIGEGVNTLAQRTADKISGNSTASLLTTIGIVVVVLAVIIGGAAYLLITTRNSFSRKVKGVEELANQVSDQVVRVSDEVNFLPEANRARADAAFGEATRNFSDANSKLRELQKVSPVTLLLKGPEYQRKLDLTGAQFNQARQALTRVEQQVKSLPGL